MEKVTVMPANARRLPVWGFVVLAVFYLAVIRLTTTIFTLEGSEYATFGTTEAVLRNLYPIVIVGSIISLVAVGILRWWHPVMRDEIRTPRWTLLFPILMVVSVLVSLNYQGLMDHGIGFSLLLLGGTFLVGVSEETMFRGIGLVSFRQAGFSEGWAAFWIAALFGLGHAINIIENGVSQTPQVLLTALAGYLFYLVRRSTGFLVVGWLVHALWDLGTFSAKLTDPPSTRAVIQVATLILLTIIGLVMIRKIFPRRPDQVESSESATGTPVGEA